ncbi:hypothetical protein [Butyricimonas faecalis]|uniref:hypothetical protein n=2 Tax=Butyricimonas faecalis TaxID=2093856 RepID=UPI000D0BA147|nr:hypothetical protein [Butyricimonas faecalis]
MYGTRYILRWESEKYNHDYKILIKERDYTGETEKKSLGEAPLLRRDDSDSGISGTSLEMVIQADVDGELTSLYTVDNKKFLVELYKNNSLIWTGYVLPEKYSEPYVPVPYDVSVTASDGLGILKDIPFTLSGEKTLFEVTRFCCNQTGMTLDFIVFSSLVESSMNTGNSMLVQTSLDVSTFQDKTCYEVLESILTSLDAFITEANGKWVIARYTDLDKEGFLYSNTGGSSGKVSLEPRVLGNVHSELYPIGNLELEIEPANKSVKFTSDYDLRPSFLQNHDFSGGDSGWGGFEYVIAKRKGVGFAAMHGNSGKQERYIQQSVSVEKSSQAVIVEVKFALAQMFASMNGRAGEDREFALKIQLSGEGQTYYLTDEGWGTKDFRFPVHGSLQDMFWDRGISTNYVDDYESNFKVTADGFPASGQLTISIYNIYVEMSGTSNVRSSLFLSHVIVTNDYGSGIDVSVNLAEKASTSHEDVDICLTDVPFVENADKMFYNGLKVAGKYTSSWACGGKTDSFLYTILKSVCSRIGFPRKQLSGTIQGENLESFMLLVDKYSDSLFQTREFSLNLLTDEMNVTLEQFMPYQELSGTATESPRVPGNNTSEYRSSGENETRVYQSGVGVPTRVRDLSPVELQADSVIEVDRANVAKSGKATLQKVLEFVLNNGKVWTEEKLKVVEGYILYLGEKIKAGDSDMWSGHSFDDYLDQAVKGDSDVKFKSVTSTAFESKVKGWIIDALGDTEFRDVLLRSFKSWNFASGPLGAGVGMVNDDELQTDKLLVRKIMYVLEMMIQRMRFQGGQMVLSPAAGFKVNSVEVFDTYYRLRCHPGDFNEFEVNDQARIQNFNGSDTKYLWSLVVAKGDDYIDISRVDKDGDGVPAEGDEIVQLGNRTNTNRQDAVLLSAVNGEVGIFTYFGINSFDLSGKEGSWFGKHGGKKGAVIKGEVHITAGSDGLDKFNEYEEVSQDIQDAQASANEADRKAQAAQDFIDNTLPGELSELRGIIDGQIESFFYNYDPTMSNYPASSWTTTEDKERHLNDTFTNTSTGASWRFLKEGDEYKWVEIADTATKEALKLAGEAKSTAASKRRVFVVEPTPPYEVGDLWTQGVSGDLMRCVKERLSGSYVSSDWEKASKYTDDTKVNNLQIGGINLADYSGGNFLNALGLYDSSYASKGSIDGKTCLIFNRNSANCRFAPVTVENGEYTFSIWVKGSEEYDAQVLHYDGANYGATTVHVTTSWERKVMTFTAKAGTDVIHWGTKNTIYIADWKYEKGNKVTDWSPSIADQNRYATEQGEAAVDNLQVGSVNLVSRKMMLTWNEKNKDIALWGQDSDGIYLAIEQSLLYYNVCGGSSNNDMFGGAIKYKNNTQYVISVKWKLAGVQSGNNAGLVIYVKYTDGTTTSVRLASTQTSLTREDLVTSKGKTVAKIYSSFGTNTYRSLVYSLALYEGNKALTEIPVATEDLQGQSNVNLVDGGKEVTVTAGASSTHSHTALVVPKLKPNTVYHLSFNASNLVGSPDKYSAILYNYENSTQFNDTLNSTSGGIIITRNNFTEGAYHLLLYAGAAGSTNGNSVKFTEVMLVEGFTPPSSYSPSPGDVQKEIEQSSTITKDDFAKEMGYESFQDMADKATGKGGKLVVDGLLNANLIDVETLAANNAFINKLSTNILTAGSITAEMLSVAGFTFENNNIYSGSKFGEGAGVNIVSNISERAFKAYKDENNFVSMFYNSDTDWGLKGVVGSKTVFQLGNSDGEGTFIGPFNFTETQLVSSSDVTIGGTVYKQGFTLENNRLSFHHAVSSIYQRGIQMGVTNGTNYGTDTLFAVEGGDIYHQGTVTTPSGSSYTSRACRFYASDIIARGLLELKSQLRFNDGAYESAYPYSWSYSSNGTIPTAGRRLVYVYGNTGSDNPCTLGTTGAIDGQVITIINTNTSHRLNITGTAKGNHWILEGCCGTFRYLSGFQLWYPERFSW